MENNNASSQSSFHITDPTSSTRDTDAYAKTLNQQDQVVIIFYSVTHNYVKYVCHLGSPSLLYIRGRFKSHTHRENR